MNAMQYGRYRIVSELGKGAMGMVYQAHDPQIDRMIARQFECNFIHLHTTSMFMLDAFLEIDELRGFEINIEAFNIPVEGTIQYYQMVQDADVPMGKVLWIAGHSGPETADDSRTHFGVFSPVCTQAFPAGQVLNLYPWEYNEVPVMLAEAFSRDVPIIALHLTRPPIEIPHRNALGIPTHMESRRGAYILRDFNRDLPEAGTVFVQGTVTTLNVLKLLDKLDSNG